MPPPLLSAHSQAVATNDGELPADLAVRLQQIATAHPELQSLIASDTLMIQTLLQVLPPFGWRGPRNPIPGRRPRRGSLRVFGWSSAH